MKQFRHIFAILILTALFGCVKTEYMEVPDQEILFSVGNYAPATKVAALNEVASVYAFNSKAYLYAEGYMDASQDFFGAAGETISARNASGNIVTSGSVSQWAPSHPYYWPKSSNSYINFVSWYDKNGTPSISETSFSISNRTIVADDEILLADVAWRYSANNDPGTYYTTGVPTMFRHLLSRVIVNLRASLTADPDNASNTYEVTLQSASLTGVYNTGSLSLSNSDLMSCGTRAWSSNGNSSLLWTPDTTSPASISLVSSNTTLGTTATNILAERSFMPQELEDGAILNITYTVTARSNGVVTNSECDIPATLVLNTIDNTAGFAITQWLPGKRYTYNISINPVSREILLNPTLESDWTYGPDWSATVE
ncbi:MAG: fimbrillin family protein [Bacteroidales bacterium]|nr:fimbrillin family protein [Bacteroidales bacterium]